MLIYKAFHIIAMVAWFAGLFYLPRLFVYHAKVHDAISNQRFKTMERRLYYGITWPAGVLTTVLGLIMLHLNPYFIQTGWMQAKLGLVFIVWGYHFSCGYYLKRFAKDANLKKARFFRFFNELPTLLLVGIVLLVVVKPF